ncbi:MAG: HAMP domain-containing sensor histidine kinase [Thermodesulfobacteriota bacterium]
MAQPCSPVSVHPLTVVWGVGGLALAGLGMVAFNLGYVGLYGAFLPLLCVGLLLSVEIGEDFFLSLLLLAGVGTLLYAVGLFALPLVLVSVGVTLPVAVLLHRWGVIALPRTLREDPRPGWRILELLAILQVALLMRYVLYRSGGGGIPLRIGELESLSRFLVGEIGGWVVFAFGYGVQHRLRYGVLYSPRLEFAASLPSLLATGLFLVSPYVAIMTLGLNTFGVTGLYVGTLPVGAAHLLMRTLTTRRLEIERQNLRLQQMNVDLARSERMAAIGQMSSTISHQILQKVGLLGLQCDLLRDLLQDRTVPVEELVREARERVGQLDRAVDDLNATLSDLLVFSRDFALHLHVDSLPTLVREAAEELGAAAAARGIDLVYRCEGEGEGGGSGHMLLPVDRIKLKQAFLNLLTNAIDASPSPGRVEVVVREQGGSVRVAVVDRGPGIAEDHMEHIFAPFFSTKPHGGGLGLTFARKIIELHSGTLVAMNNPDGGATFLAEFPVRPAQGGGA